MKIFIAILLYLCHIDDENLVNSFKFYYFYSICANLSCQVVQSLNLQT